MSKLRWTAKPRCVFCRRKADLRYNFVCKRHKNRKLNLTFYNVPVRIVDEEVI